MVFAFTLREFVPIITMLPSAHRYERLIEFKKRKRKCFFFYAGYSIANCDLYHIVLYIVCRIKIKFIDGTEVLKNRAGK